MPDPTPEPGDLKAAATSEDVRRAFYEQTGYDRWICEMQLDPATQLIVMDDSTGGYFRVPFTVDGDSITFSDAVPVAVEYVDKKIAAAAVVYASRAESIGDLRAAAIDQDEQRIEAAELEPEQDGDAPDETEQTPVTEPVSGPTTKENTDMQFSDEQLAALRAKLGLPEDATLDPATLVDGIEKLAASGEGSQGKTSTTKNLPGTITVDREVWDGMHQRIRKLEEVRAAQAVTERDRSLMAAVEDGKFAPSRVDHWRRLWDADPEGTREVLASLTPGTVPVSDLGVMGEAESSFISSEFEHLFAPRGK